MGSSRRIFLMTLATGSAALAAGSALAQAKAPAPAKSAPPAAPAAGPAPLDEKDSQAQALGYVADSTKADQKKFPNHANTQTCSNCALYQGKAGEAHGPCPIFAGKPVSAKGWCSAHAKKA